MPFITVIDKVTVYKTEGVSSQISMTVVEQKVEGISMSVVLYYSL